MLRCQEREGAAAAPQAAAEAAPPLLLAFGGAAYTQLRFGWCERMLMRGLATSALRVASDVAATGLLLQRRHGTTCDDAGSKLEQRTLM